MTTDRRPGMRLPEDPAYWEDLAARSVEAAFGSSAGGAGSPVAYARGAAFDPWWRGMSDAAFVLAASAVLAVLGGSLLLDQPSPRATTQPRAATESRALTSVLAPEDPLLASLLEAPAGPPPASALLRLIAQREEAR